MIGLLCFLFVVIVFAGLQRFGSYSLYMPMTNKPWSHWERFQFKWFLWFPWARLENEYNSAVVECINNDPTHEGPPLPPPNVWRSH
jgi:hypothetical protein